MTSFDPKDWRGLVVVCGGTRWDGMISPERSVARRLARSVPVLFLDPPLSLVRVPKTEAPAGRLRLIDDRLAHLTPVVQPGVDRRGLARVTEQLMRFQLRRAVGKLGGDVHAVLVANQRDLLGACKERMSVVYATDDFVAAARLFGVSEDVLVEQQKRQARRADLIVCVSDEIAASWAPFGVETMVMRNGCDMEVGAAADDAPLPPGVSLKPPVAGFLGNVSERIDVPLLEAVADRGMSLLIVGPARGNQRSRAQFDRLLAHECVTWTGEQPSDTMASYLRVIDVGLTPYTNSAFNRGSFPLKTIEYLAAGRAAVSTDLPATRWLDTDLIGVADDPQGFADAVQAAAAVPRTPELMAARRTFAAKHSWEARVDELKARLGI
jgi:teichuronic acid biosynthesis glycosyltransferase TuaH